MCNRLLIFVIITNLWICVMPELKLTQGDDGKRFEVRAGSPIVVALPENPTTGYRWAVDQSDDRLLTLRDSDYSLPMGGGIGGSGTRRFTFETSGTGTARLKLKLWREWEGDSSVSSRFSITIEVK